MRGQPRSPKPSTAKVDWVCRKSLKLCLLHARSGVTGRARKKPLSRCTSIDLPLKSSLGRKLFS
jgi:hypothetical protein